KRLKAYKKEDQERGRKNKQRRSEKIEMGEGHREQSNKKKGNRKEEAKRHAVSRKYSVCLASRSACPRLLSSDALMPLVTDTAVHGCVCPASLTATTPLGDFCCTVISFRSPRSLAWGCFF
ncbi:unnamed protein product, partial [Pylaiella littoralis]